ncbi:hypothetical protein [Stappia sp.]|uniref:hypothetical protein n=1 Tax=Stappia sp. TaxID=1870903 RepID=UPI0032D94922
MARTPDHTPLPPATGDTGAMPALSPTPLLAITLLLTLAVGLADALHLALGYWGGGRTFDAETSGVWTALALDAANGLVYRPVLAEDGYGGTRYMPVFFLLHGLAIRLIGDATLAGVLLMQASVILMVAAIARLIVQQGVAPIWAIAVALLTYITTLYQQYLSDVNCDYLAAAFSLWGLSLFLGRTDGRARRAAQAFGLVLMIAAFYTKFSTVYVPAALFLSYVVHGRWRAALAFAVAALALLIAVGAAFHVLSDGRMIEALAATATGGTDLAFALGFARRFAEELILYHPAVGVCFLLALGKWALDGPRRWRAPLHLTFVLVTLVTLVVFTSRGISGNHLIPLHAVSLVLLGSALTGSRGQRRALAAGIAVLGLIVVATWLPGVPSVRATLAARANPSIAEIRAAIDRHVPPDGLLYAHHPMYPIVAGRRPFVLDVYNLDLFLRRDHPVGRDFRTRLAEAQFDALIVPHPDRIARILGADSDAARRYRVADTLGRYTILVRAAPRDQSPGARAE